MKPLPDFKKKAEQLTLGLEVELLAAYTQGLYENLKKEQGRIDKLEAQLREYERVAKRLFAALTQADKKLSFYSGEYQGGYRIGTIRKRNRAALVAYRQVTGANGDNEELEKNKC